MHPLPLYCQLISCIPSPVALLLLTAGAVSHALPAAPLSAARAPASGAECPEDALHECRGGRRST